MSTARKTQSVQEVKAARPPRAEPRPDIEAAHARIVSRFPKTLAKLAK